MRLLLFVLSLTLLSCSALQQSNLVQKPKVTDWKVKLSGLTFDDVTLEYRVKLYNPNSIGLKVDNYSYAIGVEGNTLTSGKQDKRTEIKANDSMWVSVPVTFTYKELYQLGKAYVKSDSLNLQFKSDFGLDIPVLGIVSIPFETQKSIPMLSRPSLKIASFKLDDVSLLGAKFALKLEVDNPNSIPIDLGKIGFSFKVNDKAWLSSAIEKTASIASKGKSEISVPIAISFADVGISLFNSIRNGEPFSYALEGDLNVKIPLFDSEMIKLPVRSSGQLKLNF